MSSSTSRATTSDLVKGWFKTRNPGLELEALADDTDLIESRILDSLQFIEFLLFIEEVSGRPVDFQAITLDDFRTISAVHERLLADDCNGDEVVI